MQSFQEIFAPEWMNIADYLDRIAQITDMVRDDMRHRYLLQFE